MADGERKALWMDRIKGFFTWVIMSPRRLPILAMTVGALFIAVLQSEQIRKLNIQKPFEGEGGQILVMAIGLVMTGVVALLADFVFLRHDSYLTDHEFYYPEQVRRHHRRADEPTTSNIDAESQYKTLSVASRSLAASLYNRSGVYLLSGVAMAIGGIATFYFLRPILPPSRSPADVIIALLPGSSMLLLVELIAFFFLRQSRAVMDEFRHFDHLARKREELLVAMRLAAEAGKPLDIVELMASGYYFTRSDRFGPGESSEIVESRKLEKTEIDLLNKVVELVGKKATS